MQTGQQHIIRRVVLEVDSHTQQKDTSTKQAQLAALCRERLPALLDRCLAEWGSLDVLYQVDCIELDIEGVNLDQLDLEWVEKVEPQLRAALQSAQPHHQSKQKSAARSAAELLLFFLENGWLPWWADAVDNEAIQKSLHIVVAEFEAGTFPHRLAFRRALAKTEAQFRLTRHGNDAELLEISRLLSAPALTQAIVGAFSTLSAAISNWPAARRRFWPTVWQVVVTDAYISLSAEENLRLQLWETMPEVQALSDFLPAMNQTLAGLDRKIGLEKSEQVETPPIQTHWAEDSKGTKTEWKAKENDAAQDLPGSSKEPEKTDPQPINQMKPRPAEASLNIADKPGVQPSSGQNEENRAGRQKATGDFDESDRLYLNNAGLVLLAPYLPKLWERLGWVHERAFTGLEERFLAVELCQFLCDGQEDPPEYHLVLPKILCGLSPDVLYVPERSLNSDERAEGKALLESVLKHAPGLGLKTTDGLRGSFLLRKGLLRSGGNHWLLHVEKETYDIVLNQLPWNFQVVKYPWMEMPIMVDWLFG